MVQVSSNPIRIKAIFISFFDVRKNECFGYVLIPDRVTWFDIFYFSGSWNSWMVILRPSGKEELTQIRPYKQVWMAGVTRSLTYDRSGSLN